MNYILDACALIAWLDEEKGAGYEAVDALIEQAQAGDCIIRMSAVNWVEVFYHFIRNAGEETADEIMAAAAELPITLIDTIDPPARRAAALGFQATIVTKDGEISAAEQQERLSVLWIC